uniref:Ig-like domain-containing protein n=1 Tax=Stegastes partitus TaxID=144197 RepID=A0A3B4ZSU5_9TELE
MKHLTLIPALFLCSFGCLSLSATESQTVKVQPGEDVTLLCSNFSSSPGQIIWFRLFNGTHPRCISSIFSSIQPASLCSGVENGKLELTSNSSTLFLKIKHVDSSDSGFYFCGYTIKTHPVIVSSTYVQVPEESDGTPPSNLLSFILAGVTVLLILVIIGLIVQNRKLKTADKQEQNPEQSETLDPDDLDYTTVAFQPNVNRREPGPEPVPEPEVIYSATR